MMRNDEEILPRLAPVYAAGERLVFFLVNQGILGRVSAERVAINPEGAQRIWVLLGVKQGLAILRPNQVLRHVCDNVWQKLASLQVLEADGVKATASGIRRERHHLLIRMNVPTGEGKELVSFGQFILVQEDFFWRLEISFLATMYRIL